MSAYCVSGLLQAEGHQAGPACKHVSSQACTLRPDLAPSACVQEMLHGIDSFPPVAVMSKNTSTPGASRVHRFCLVALVAGAVEEGVHQQGGVHVKRTLSWPCITIAT